MPVRLVVASRLIRQVRQLTAPHLIAIDLVVGERVGVIGSHSQKHRLIGTHPTGARDQRYFGEFVDPAKFRLHVLKNEGRGEILL